MGWLILFIVVVVVWVPLVLLLLVMGFQTATETILDVVRIVKESFRDEPNGEAKCTR